MVWICNGYVVAILMFLLSFQHILAGDFTKQTCQRIGEQDIVFRLLSMDHMADRMLADLAAENARLKDFFEGITTQEFELSYSDTSGQETLSHYYALLQKACGLQNESLLETLGSARKNVDLLRDETSYYLCEQRALLEQQQNACKDTLNVCNDAIESGLLQVTQMAESALEQVELSFQNRLQAEQEKCLLVGRALAQSATDLSITPEQLLTGEERVHERWEMHCAQAEMQESAEEKIVLWQGDFNRMLAQMHNAMTNIYAIQKQVAHIIGKDELLTVDMREMNDLFDQMAQIISLVDAYILQSRTDFFQKYATAQARMKENIEKEITSLEKSVANSIDDLGKFFSICGAVPCKTIANYCVDLAEQLSFCFSAVETQLQEVSAQVYEGSDVLDSALLPIQQNLLVPLCQTLSDLKSRQIHVRNSLAERVSHAGEFIRKRLIDQSLAVQAAVTDATQREREAIGKHQNSTDDLLREYANQFLCNLAIHDEHMTGKVSQLKALLEACISVQTSALSEGIIAADERMFVSVMRMYDELEQQFQELLAMHNCLADKQHAQLCEKISDLEVCALKAIDGLRVDVDNMFADLGDQIQRVQEDAQKVILKAFSGYLAVLNTLTKMSRTMIEKLEILLVLAPLVAIKRILLAFI